MSRDSSVGIATGYGLNGRSSITSRDNIFSLLHSVQTGSRAHPASYLIGNGVKQPGLEADHSLPSGTEVTNSGAIPPTPHTFSWSSA
jgi:hypothetical protein